MSNNSNAKPLVNSQPTNNQFNMIESKLDQTTSKLANMQSNGSNKSLVDGTQTTTELTNILTKVTETNTKISTLFDQSTKKSLVDSKATTTEISTIDARLEKLTTSVQQLVQLNMNQPMIQAQPTVSEMNKVQGSTQLTEGFFKRLEGTIRDLTAATVSQTLFNEKPTTRSLKAAATQADVTKESLKSVYDSLDSETKTAFKQLDLVTEGFKIQQREVDILTKKLAEGKEFAVNSDSLLDLEKKVNNAQIALERKRQTMAKVKDEAYRLDQQMFQVSESMTAVSNNKSFDNLGKDVDRSISRIQTLIDKMKQIGSVPVDKFTNGLNRGLQTVGNGVDNLKQKFFGIESPIGKIRSGMNSITESIKGSDIAQSRFGQTVAKSGNLVSRFLSGVRKGGADLLSITGRATVATAKLPFAWLRLVPIVGRVVNSIRQKQQATKDVTNELGNAGNKTERLGSLVRMVKFAFWLNAIKQVSRAIAGIAEQVDNVSKTMATMKIMLDVTGSKTALQSVTNQVMAAAMDSRSAWQDTAGYVNQLGLTAGELFRDTSEIVGFTNILQKAFKAGGATVQEMDSGIQQLAVGLARGTIQTEELTQMMRNAPLAIQALSDYLGVSTTEMKGLAEEGLITANVLRNALFAAADDINAKFEMIPITWAERWQQVQNVALAAIMPFIDAWNEFVASEAATIFFDNLTLAFVYLAQIAMWAFNYIVLGFNYLMENIEVLKMALVILGTIIGAVFLYFAMSMIQVISIIAVVILAIWGIAMVLDALGFTASDVIAWIVAGTVWMATAFYEAGMFIAGLFVSLFQVIFNLFNTFWNQTVSIAEFFMNVWNNPIYSTQMLFYNFVVTVVGFFAAIVDGAGNAGDAIGDTFVNGANIALRAINWIVDGLNKIPGVDLGKMGEVGKQGGRRGARSAGGKMKAAVEVFNPGAAPAGYKSLAGFKGNNVTVDGLQNALAGMKGPNQQAMKAYAGTKQALAGGQDFLKGFDKSINLGTEQFQGAIGNGADIANAIPMADRLADPPEKKKAAKGAGKKKKPAGDKAKKGAKAGDKAKKAAGKKGSTAADKIGKGKELGDIGKVKDEINISDEDLKYMRDIAETNFVVKLQQLSPSATVNLNGSGSTEADAKKLLALMEDMIEEGIGTSTL